jgi:hypothetical protein
MASHLKYVFERANLQEFAQFITLECPTDRPSDCPGFRFAKHYFPKQHPLPGIHYDAERKKPITLICHHEGECQVGAEYLYALIHSYASGFIDKATWARIFPSRGNHARGYPSFSSYFGTPKHLRKTCPGFKLSLGPCTTKLDLDVPNSLRKGYEMNPVTNTPYTVPCDHNDCEKDAVYKFAVYTAYYNCMLGGIDPSDSLAVGTDPKYVILKFGWNTIFNNVTGWYGDELKDYHKWSGNRYILQYASFLVWDPATLVKNTSAEFKVYNPNIISDDSDSAVCTDEDEGEDTVDRVPLIQETPGISANYTPSAPPLEEAASSSKKRRITPMQFDDDEEDVSVNLYKESRVSTSYNATRAWMSNKYAPMVHLKRRMPKQVEEEGATTPQAKDYYLNFRLDHDAAGVIEYLSMFAAEIRDPSLSLSITQALERGLSLVKNPEHLASQRKEKGQALKRLSTTTNRLRL